MADPTERLNAARPPAASAGLYAVHSSETASPSPGGQDRQDAGQSGLTWIVLAAFAVGGFLAYTKIWPALQGSLYRPSPIRDYLLVPSTDPQYVIAGVGVGWFWILFIAAPLAAAVTALLWWAMLAAANRGARSGQGGQLRLGQRWSGEQEPAGPLILSGAAVVLAAGGALLRWAGPVATTALGLLVCAAVLIVSGFGYVQYVRWALGRAQIARQIAEVTFLVTPLLGWRDLRSGRVRVTKRAYPRVGKPFPRGITMFYGSHPRAMDAVVVEEVLTQIHQVTGHDYVIEHDPQTRTLTAQETEIVVVDPVLDGAAVLAPLVAEWFDPTAHLSDVTVSPAAAAPEAASEMADGDQAVPAAENGTSATIASRISAFTVEFTYSRKVKTAYARGGIEAAVSDALHGAWEADWNVAGRTVTFTRCPGLPTMVSPPLDLPAVTRALIRSLYKSTAIPFAVDAYGNVLAWDFRSSPHMLVSGPTSTGKTSLLMTIATQCAARGINVVWLDPKGFDSPGLRDWPNFSLVTEGTDDDGMVAHAAALRFIADTMRERLAQVKINPNRAGDFDPIIVLTDEFANLVMELLKFYARYQNRKIDKGRPPTEEDVGTILRTARAVGIHMVIGLQRPDTTFISGEARDNTALRVAMGRLRSKDAAIMMFNDPVAGTRVQPGIKGRGTVQLPDNSIREIQVFYTPTPPATDEQRAALSDANRSILKTLSSVDSFWPRRVVDSALRDYDPEDPEAVMSFKQIRDSEIVLASDRPDLDPLSDQYVPARCGQRKPTMDDAHEDLDELNSAATTPPLASVPAFGGPVDGFDDEYLPTLEDEYSAAVPATADDVEYGDLVDVSIDGVTSWKYVHADPYPCGDEEDDERMVIPYRDVDDSQDFGDLEVDPHTVLQVRKLAMI